MTGLVRKALTIAAGLAVVASVASADVPSPQQSVVEAIMVGDISGNPLGAGGSIGTQAVPGFEVLVRDVNLTPLFNKLVVLDFSATTIKLIGPNAAVYDGATVNCTAKTLSKATDIAGKSIFSARFGGYSNTASVEVSASGVVLALVKARSTDIDAVDGTTGLNDFALFSTRFAAVLPAQEVNYDLSVSDVPDLSDFTILAKQFASAASGTYCP